MADARIQITEGTGKYLDEESLSLGGYTVHRPRFQIAGAAATDLCLPVAHDAADAGNPLKVGASASINFPSAVSADGDRVNLAATRTGALYTVGAPALGYQYIPGYGFAAQSIIVTTGLTITAGTGVSLIPAGGAGVYTYLLAIKVMWGVATATTWLVKKGTVGGTIMWTGQTGTTGPESDEAAPPGQYLAKSDANAALWLDVSNTVTAGAGNFHVRYVQATV